MSESILTLNPAPLDTTVIGSRVLVFQEVDSTNDRAFAIGVDGAVVVADTQNAGRGRHGRVWVSPPGVGLWFSVFLEGDVVGLPFAGPLAVWDTLIRHYRKIGARLSGKWPNDLLLNGKKCCGTLVERKDTGTVIGIGINVCQTEQDFPAELRDRAISLLMGAGHAPPRAELLRHILHMLDAHVQLLRNDPLGADHLSQRWFDICRMQGRPVAWRGGKGIIEKVDRTGVLYVRQDGAIASVPFDDSVTVLPTDCGDAA